jgi:hypothetical protein
MSTTELAADAARRGEAARKAVQAPLLALLEATEAGRPPPPALVQQLCKLLQCDNDESCVRQMLQEARGLVAYQQAHGAGDLEEPDWEALTASLPRVQAAAAGSSSKAGSSKKAAAVTAERVLAGHMPAEAPMQKPSKEAAAGRTAAAVEKQYK